jgi:predicted nucleic acid-binding protein
MDALLIAAAESSNCVELITEDFNDGQIIDGVVPFSRRYYGRAHDE